MARNQPGGQPDLQKLMRQAAEMQAGLQQQQEDLAAREFTGTAGGGVVSATVTGDGRVTAVIIDPSVLDPDDAEMVGDLVVAAINAAMGQVAEAAAESMGGLGDLDIGGLLGGPGG
jgi:DNA-binding YbaB/EbfC family protein